MVLARSAFSQNLPQILKRHANLSSSQARLFLIFRTRSKSAVS